MEGSMSEKMIELYKQLNTNDKRNELSSLIEKLDQLVNQVMIQKGINNNYKQAKNYDSINQNMETEDDVLLFFYEDIWNIKSKILALLAHNSGGNNNG